MNIQILHMKEGARAARGVTVIIDVFRAFSMEAYLLARGARRVIPVGDQDLAYRLKEEDPQRLLAGERHGKILPGFDLGNAPSALLNLDVTGRTVVHTTSAGTQGIANALHADEILGAGLVNARATADYIRRSGAQTVSLVCMGLEAVTQTEEDNLCAEYIKCLLAGGEMDIRTEADKLRYTSGAKFFDPAQQEVFPQPDFDLCIAVDTFDFVMRLTKDADGLAYMQRVDI